MTPTELHSRILLHELRTILLDETREGGSIPQAWKDQLQADPHNSANYLVLADWLDDQGDPLGELSRIQVELIDGVEFPKGAQWISAFISDSEDGLETRITLSPQAHPFQNELATSSLFTAIKGKEHHRTNLCKRRWEITQELYATHPPFRGDRVFRPRINRSSRLGRTTRMLTDILRYCALNKGKRVLAVHLRAAQTFLAMEKLYCELRSIRRTERFPRDYVGNPTVANVWKNTIRFLAPRVNYPQADITFTDHACQREQVGISPVQYAQHFAAERQDHDTLTCIGGPYDGENRTLNRASRSLRYAEHKPISITEWANADGFAQRPAFTTHEYRRRMYADPSGRTYEYLIHEDLTDQQADDRIIPILNAQSPRRPSIRRP